MDNIQGHIGNIEPSLRRGHLIRDFDNFLPHELSIYEKAALTHVSTHRDSKIDTIELSDNHMNIAFGISGEIKGHAICKADFSNLADDSSLSFYQGLFVESMNILLGKILTSVENKLDLMCYLTPPKTINADNLQTTSFKEIFRYKESSYIIKSLYDLRTEQVLIPCSINFEIMRHKSLEV